MTGTDLIVLGQRTVLPPGDLATEVDTYLRHKRKRLTEASRAGYKSTLDELVRFFPTHQLADFAPPFGVAPLEQFLADRWGDLAPRTYNKNLAVISDFFKWQARRGRIQGDPTLTIERAKARPVNRLTFTPDQRDRIFYASPDLDDQVALHLLLDYGIRKGALRGVRFGDFNPETRKLTVFTKGEKIHRILIPDDGIWHALDELNGQPNHYLLCRQVTRRRTIPHRRQLDATRDHLSAATRALASVEDPQAHVQHHRATEVFTAAKAALAALIDAASWQTRRYPDEPMGQHSLHDWWYGCLQRAGIVDKGVTRGARMHAARHTAGQRILDATGNLKAVQRQLGHATISTTGDVYVDQSDDQMREHLRATIGNATLDDTLLNRTRPDTNRSRS